MGFRGTYRKGQPVLSGSDVARYTTRSYSVSVVLLGGMPRIILQHLLFELGHQSGEKDQCKSKHRNQKFRITDTLKVKKIKATSILRFIHVQFGPVELKLDTTTTA